jgi:hypothetical protein
MIAEVSTLMFFAIEWLPRNPRQALRVLAVHVGAALTALAPIFFSTFRPRG